MVHQIGQQHIYCISIACDLAEALSIANELAWNTDVCVTDLDQKATNHACPISNQTSVMHTKGPEVGKQHIKSILNIIHVLESVLLGYIF